MRSFLISLVVVLVFVAGSAFAGSPREIELKDGSIITGEVISLSNGIYTIRSDSLGTVKIEESKISVMRSKSSSQSSGVAQGKGDEITSLRNKMMSDQEIMNLIQSLQNNPEFKKILEDPDVMKAVNEADIPALMANPKFINLLNNPTVQEIQKKVK
jgi:hypothetical protein